MHPLFETSFYICYGLENIEIVKLDQNLVANRALRKNKNMAELA